MDANNPPINVTRSSMPPLEEYVETIRVIWENRQLTNAGCLHEELSARLKEHLGAGQLVLFTNGHMALELALQALELKGEVITTPFTFASTTQAIVRNGLTPVFCDIDPVRFTLDPEKLEALITERTCAIVAVHVYGIPCDTHAIEAVASKHGLKVIYDAAHAFGVSYRGSHIAQYGDISMFSFHATKSFHTIEGGALAFGDFELCGRLFRLRNFGIAPGGSEAESVGTNAKLSEFHAAMGLCNLRHIKEEIEKRRTVSDRYDARLKGAKGLRLFPEIDGLVRNYAYYPVVFLDGAEKSRDQAFELLKSHNIMARKYFYPLTSDFACYKDLPRQKETPIARDIANRVLCLPLYAGLTAEQADGICDILLGV